MNAKVCMHTYKAVLYIVHVHSCVYYLIHRLGSGEVLFNTSYADEPCKGCHPYDAASLYMYLVYAHMCVLGQLG